MHKAKKIPLMVAGGIAAAAVLLIVFGMVVQLLWNWLMPDIFGVSEVTFWQAVGLVLLGHLLFGGGHKFRHSRVRHHHKPLHRKTCDDAVAPPGETGEV